MAERVKSAVVRTPNLSMRFRPLCVTKREFCSRFLNSRPSPSPRPSPRARGEGERFLVTFTQGGASLALGYFLTPLTGLCKEEGLLF